MYDFLDELLTCQFDNKYIDEIKKGYVNKKTTFRINKNKTTSKYVENILNDSNILYSKVSFFDDAFILDSNIDITELDIYKNGMIYVQNLSSMLPMIILNPQSDNRILDMAASPGGKTTQACSMTLNTCYITAIEKNKIRCERLKYNIEKQGCKKVTVLNMDATKLDDLYSFDKILLDAPCTGSGTLTEKFNEHFNLELLNRCVSSQASLLEVAFKVLKKGGTLVYSTCSILSEENELQIKKIIEKYNLEIEPIEIDLPGVKLLPTIKGCILVCPDDIYEGFFIAKLKKV